MILNEVNKVIGGAIKNIDTNLKLLKGKIKDDLYLSIQGDFRELIGLQMHITKEYENSKYEQDLVDRCLDFDNDVKELLNKQK